MKHFLLLLLLASPALSAAELAGNVVYQRGAAFVNRSQSSENLTLSSPLHAGDRIVTGRNTRLQMKMVDGSVLTLGENTEFVIATYRYIPQQQGSARFELVKGVFRAITGAIGKFAERDFKVSTPVATIGVRGTDFWGGYHFSEALDVALLDGKGIIIENAAGNVEITHTGEGTTIQQHNLAPSTPKRWGDAKLNAAKQSVAFEDETPK